MKKYFLILSFFVPVLICGCAQQNSGILLTKWLNFETQVRDQKISPQKAKKLLNPLLNSLSGYIAKRYEIAESGWVFPVEGYGLKALDKNNFKPEIIYGPYGIKGYDFFGGNRHGGHPAYDIFIKDKNQDSLDDKTNLAVKALAMTDMFVLSVRGGWKMGNILRGGNYVWLINPKENKLFYYAHLKDIYVKPGDFVKQGRAVGTVGRTGYLAAKKSSPTHIHLMVLEIEKENLKPFNYIQLLDSKSNK